jgi:Low molecular weight phosphotyrosine protein phosphatase
VNPYAVRVLAEIGIDWSAATSKSVTEFLERAFDYVITVCDRARQSCPVFPGQYNALHWGLEDPAEVEGTDEEKLAAFRKTRVELAERLSPFIEGALRAAGREPRIAPADTSPAPTPRGSPPTRSRWVPAVRPT